MWKRFRLHGFDLCTHADIAEDKVERVSEFRHERKKEKKMEEIWVRSVVEQKNKR